MDTIKTNPVRKKWLFMQLLPWGIIAMLSLGYYLFIKSNNPKTSFLFLMSILLCVGNYFFWKKFSLLFGPDTLNINQLQFFGDGRNYIPYNLIEKIYIKQTPIDKILNFSTLIILLNSPEEEDKITTKFFGAKLYLLSMVPRLGKSGNIINISGLKPQTAEQIKNILVQNHKVHLTEFKYIGIGYPYNNILTSLMWIYKLIFIGLMLFLAIILLMIMLFASSS